MCSQMLRYSSADALDSIELMNVQIVVVFCGLLTHQPMRKIRRTDTQVIVPKKKRTTRKKT